MNAPVSKSDTIFSTSGGDPLVGEVLSFLALPNKWCYGRGGPAKIEAVLNALQILRLLRDLGYDRMEVFPDPAGGVLLSAFFGIDSVEVLCRDTKEHYDFVFETPGRDDVVEDNVDQSVVLRKLWEISCAPQKNSSGYCTRVSTVNISIDSKVWHSRILTTASRSSMPNVRYTPVVTYVPMFTDITTMYLESQRYIGVSNPTNFLLTQDLTTLSQTPETNAITLSSVFLTNTIGSGFTTLP